MRAALVCLCGLVACRADRPTPPLPAPVDAAMPMPIPEVMIVVDAAPEVAPYVAEDAGPTVVDARVDALTSEDIRAFIESRAGYLIEACATKAAATGIRDYRVTVTISPDGKPTKFLNKEFGDLALCVQNKVGVWRLPRSPAGGAAEVTVRFP